jgi:TolB-like protein
MTERADVFVSYKAEDRARLAPLVEALEHDGLSVWWDARIGGGANWREEIEKQLDLARCVLVAWSNRSVAPEGHFVRDEAARAMRLGTYLPVQIDRVEPPLGFGEIQALSLVGWKGQRSDRRLEAVIEAVRARLAGAAPVVRIPLAARVSRRAVVGAAAGAGAIAAAGGWLAFRPRPAAARRIAVMPFANLSNDPEQAYFSEGIAEELRSALSRIGLEVVGRASSAAVQALDTRAAARRLRAAHLLTGSIRRSPRMIRIAAQLVDGKDGVERWAQSYDRAPGDSIAIQTDIAANVARALSIALGREGRAALTMGSTNDSLAQDLVFRSRQALVTAVEPAEFEQALDLAESAITRDPRYADAHVQRSLVLTATAESSPGDSAAVLRQLAEAEAAARHALSIAPRLGAAHAALARIAHNRLDLAGLLRETEIALALSPDSPAVLLEAATIMATLGRGAEGLRLAQRLIALDGLNARAFARLSLVMFLLRRYRQTIEAVNRANAIAPGNPARNAIAGDAWQLLGAPDKARVEYARMPPDDYLRLTGEGILAARAGDRTGARQAMARLVEHHGDGIAFQLAVIRAQLGDRDAAFALLDQALARKDPGLVGLKTDPFLDPLRSDPRYAKLVASLRFP